MKTAQSERVVACVPAYNEERTIAKVLVRASRHVDQLIVVDDGSQDDTGVIAERLGALVIRHSKNLGKGAAMIDIFSWARKNDICVLVTLDADGQHDPDEIPALVSLVRAGEADIAIGYRSTRPPGMARSRRFAQRLLDTLVGVKEGEARVDSQSGFRAYSKKAVSNLEPSEWGMGSEVEILMKAREAGMRIRQVPAHMKYAKGEAHPRNAFVQFTDVISSVLKVILERRPLRVMGIPGLLEPELNIIRSLPRHVRLHHSRARIPVPLDNRFHPGRGICSIDRDQTPTFA